MKIPSYTQTAGLERYPQDERFAVYRASHKRLMSEDVSYRRRFQSFLVSMIFLVLIPVFGWIAAVYLAFRQQAFQNQRIGHVLQSVA